MFQIRLATPADFKTILDLLYEAAAWLATKGTDQWQQPWPGVSERDTRILQGLLACQTWIVEKNGRVAATATSKTYGSEKLWNKDDQSSPACYICRLMVGREYAGQKLGESLVDWAAARAKAEYGAKSIRIDVWTTNFQLQNYYKRCGFRFLRHCEDKTYPSAALFQKPIAESRDTKGPRLWEIRALPSPATTPELSVAPLVTACQAAPLA